MPLNPEQEYSTIRRIIGGSEPNIYQSILRGLMRASDRMVVGAPGTALQWLGGRTGIELLEDVGRSMTGWSAQEEAKVPQAQSLQRNLQEGNWGDVFLDPRYWLGGVAEQVPLLASQAIPYLGAASLATKYPRLANIAKPVLGALIAGLQEAPELYHQALAEGKSEEEAAREYELGVVAIGALNALPLEFFFRGPLANKWARMFGTSMLEGGTEMFEEYTQAAIAGKPLEEANTSAMAVGPVAAASSLILGPLGGHAQPARLPRGSEVRGGGAVEFYSPNLAEELSFDQAMSQFRGDDHARTRQMAMDVDRIMGIPSQTMDAIGDWVDGAENSYVTLFPEGIDADTLRLNAARKGLETRQKAVLPFLVDPEGSDTIYHILLPFDMQRARGALDNAGIGFRTLRPVQGGTEAWLVDFGSEMREQVDKFAEDNDVNYEYARGKAELIGDERFRAAGARSYHEIIDQYEGQGPVAGDEGAGGADWRGKARPAEGVQFSERQWRTGRGLKGIESTYAAPGVQSEELFRRAVAEYGTTDSLADAGYILPDGTLLDFSGGGGMGRTLDHRSIGSIFNQGELPERTGWINEAAMPEFQRRGAIRYGPELPGAELIGMPTDAQLRVLSEASSSGEPLIVSVNDPETDMRISEESFTDASPQEIGRFIRRAYGEKGLLFTQQELGLGTGKLDFPPPTSAGYTAAHGKTQDGHELRFSIHPDFNAEAVDDYELHIEVAGDSYSLTEAYNLHAKGLENAERVAQEFLDTYSPAKAAEWHEHSNSELNSLRDMKRVALYVSSGAGFHRPTIMVHAADFPLAPVGTTGLINITLSGPYKSQENAKSAADEYYEYAFGTPTQEQTDLLRELAGTFTEKNMQAFYHDVVTHGLSDVLSVQIAAVKNFGRPLELYEFGVLMDGVKGFENLTKAERIYRNNIMERIGEGRYVLPGEIPVRFDDAMRVGERFANIVGAAVMPSYRGLIESYMKKMSPAVIRLRENQYRSLGDMQALFEAEGLMGEGVKPSYEAAKRIRELEEQVYGTDERYLERERIYRKIQDISYRKHHTQDDVDMVKSLVNDLYPPERKSEFNEKLDLFKRTREQAISDAHEEIRAGTITRETGHAYASVIRGAEENMLSPAEREFNDAKINLLSWRDQMRSSYSGRLTNEQARAYSDAINAKIEELKDRFGEWEMRRLVEGVFIPSQAWVGEDHWKGRDSVNYTGRMSPQEFRDFVYRNDTIGRLVRYARDGMAGMNWYEFTEDTLRPLFHDDTELFVRLLAAASQGTPVDQDVHIAMAAYQAIKEGREFAPPTLYRQMKDNVERVRNGELPVGTKVENFYRSLKKDPDAVAIDRWMYRAFGWDKSGVTDKQYEVMAELLRKMAADNGITPRQLQAAIWTGIKDNGTTSLRIEEELFKELRDGDASWFLRYLPGRAEFAHQLELGLKGRDETQHVKRGKKHAITFGFSSIITHEHPVDSKVLVLDAIAIPGNERRMNAGDELARGLHKMMKEEGYKELEADTKTMENVHDQFKDVMALWEDMGIIATSADTSGIPPTLARTGIAALDDIARKIELAEARREGRIKTRTRFVMAPNGSAILTGEAQARNAETASNLKDFFDFVVNLTEPTREGKEAVDAMTQGHVVDTAGDPDYARLIMKKGNFTATAAMGPDGDLFATYPVRNGDTGTFGALLKNVEAFGVPPAAYDSIMNIGTAEMGGQNTQGLFDIEKRMLAINAHEIRALGTSPDSNAFRAAVMHLTHELGHAISIASNGYSAAATSPFYELDNNSFMIRFQPDGTPYFNGYAGPALKEALDFYVNEEVGGTLNQFLSYPLKRMEEVSALNEVCVQMAIAGDPRLDDAVNQRDAVVHWVQNEMFAQQYALYHSVPGFVQTYMPKTYEMMKEVDDELRTWKPEGTGIAYLERVVGAVSRALRSSDTDVVTDAVLASRAGQPAGEGAEGGQAGPGVSAVQGAPVSGRAPSHADAYAAGVAARWTATGNADGTLNTKKIPEPEKAARWEEGEASRMEPETGFTAIDTLLRKVEEGEDFERLTREFAARFEPEIEDARRGTVSWEDTEALARQLGRSPREVRKILRRKKGVPWSAGQLDLARQLITANGKQLQDSLADYRARRAAGNLTDTDRVGTYRLMLRQALLLSQFTGAAAEVGRALNILKKNVQRWDDETVMSVLGNIGGPQSFDELVDIIAGMPTEGSRNKLVERVWEPTFLDKVMEYYINALLSGFATDVVNITSNTMTMVYDDITRIVAAGIGKMHGGNKMLFREAFARIAATPSGAMHGLKLFGDAFMREAGIDPFQKMEIAHKHAIKGTKGKIVRLPGRLLTAEDMFFKGMIYVKELHGLAYRKAWETGQSAAELIQNPTEEMKKEAWDRARELTYTSKPGALSGTMLHLANKYPGFRFIFPFVNTPAKIVEFATKNSPLGLALGEVKNDLRAGGSRRDLALARIATGSALGAFVMMLAAKGLITGGGPDDPRERAQLRRLGWQPYSIKWNGTYYSYGRLEPLGMIMGISADMVEIGHVLGDKELNDIAAMMTGSIAKNITSKTWLRGVSEFIQFMSEPERYGEYYFRNLASGFVAPTLMAHLARQDDPVLRDARTLVDAIKARVPGQSRTLWPRLDVWGQPIVREGGVGPDILSPVYLSREKADPVTQEVQRLGILLPRIARRVGGVDIDSGQYHQLVQMAREPAYRTLFAAMRTPEYLAMTDDQKRDFIEDVVRDYRRAATQAFKELHPEVELKIIMERAK